MQNFDKIAPSGWVRFAILSAASWIGVYVSNAPVSLRKTPRCSHSRVGEGFAWSRTAMTLRLISSKTKPTLLRDEFPASNVSLGSYEFSSSGACP